MRSARAWTTGLAVLIFFGTAPSSYSAEPVHHRLTVILRPQDNDLEVKDTLTLPPSLAARDQLRFRLRKGLDATTPSPGVKISREPGETVTGHPANFDEYVVRIPDGLREIDLHYQGKIRATESQGDSSDRSPFEEGIISDQGIFLDGSAHWYPSFNEDPITFSMDTRLPDSWDAVAEGDRTRHDRQGGLVETRWESPEPQVEIILIGGKFTEYDRPNGSVEMMIFLRTPDPELADRYLESGVSYLEMYRKLIGAYPYKKFAVVENFWETGYGMPSMTLLGSSVLRLSFILESSYPHEILHNWWGNGVFVDYETGNWSEGLTTYMADHLFQEQQGSASEYRRSTLQKYVDYVAAKKDFPLSDFRSRYSPASQAIGYGKAMMFFHMLRDRLGDADFLDALRHFYADHRFKRAGFDDLRRAFSVPAGEDLKSDFDQWVTRTGAPSLKIGRAVTRIVGNDFVLSARLEQTQPGPVYRLRIPIAVTMEDREKAFQTRFEMKTRQIDIAIPIPARPVRLDIDPEFDLFRRVERGELPPAISQALGAEKGMIILPSTADGTAQQSYRAFAELLERSLSGSVEIKRDNEISAFPADRAVWVLGWENRFFPAAMKTLASYDLSKTEKGIRIGANSFERKNHTVVLASRQTRRIDSSLVWIATDPLTALPGLARKLPHYGPYSYLVFEGEDPKNTLKGRWNVTDGPLSIPVTQPDGRIVRAKRGILGPRRPLAERP